jgi:hypothetical protein
MSEASGERDRLNARSEEVYRYIAGLMGVSFRLVMVETKRTE